jgi:cholesterol transport system auxiliary component
MRKGTRPVTAMFRNRAPLAAALLPMLLLGGCISFAPKPPPELISLTPTAVAPPGDLAPGSTEPPLVVINPESGPELEVTRVPVQVTGSGIAYIKGAIWIDRPARQLRALIAETIRAKNNRLVFEGLDAVTGGRPLLTSRLITMGFDTATGEVVIRLDAQLTLPTGEPKRRRFEAKVPGVAADGKTIGPALNTAANDLAAQVAAWVG